MLRHDINFKIHFPVSFLSARPAVPRGPACCPSITVGRPERVGRGGAERGEEEGEGGWGGGAVKGKGREGGWRDIR